MLFTTLSIWLSFPSFFFFNDTTTTEIYTLSLHDALPICDTEEARKKVFWTPFEERTGVQVISADAGALASADRKSTRLNSSHEWISYAVFCLKKKKKRADETRTPKQKHQATRYTRDEMST